MFSFFLTLRSHCILPDTVAEETLWGNISINVGICYDGSKCVFNTTHRGLLWWRFHKDFVCTLRRRTCCLLNCARSWRWFAAAREVSREFLQICTISLRSLLIVSMEYRKRVKKKLMYFYDRVNVNWFEKPRTSIMLIFVFPQIGNFRDWIRIRRARLSITTNDTPEINVSSKSMTRERERESLSF